MLPLGHMLNRVNEKDNVILKAVHLYPEAADFVDLSKGRHAIVYRFNDGKSVKIIKSSPRDFSIESELFFLEKAEPLSIVPKVYYSNLKENFFVMTYIPGTSGCKELTVNETMQLYFSYGQMVNKLHQIKVDGVGYYENGKFGYNSVNSCFNEDFQKITDDTEFLKELLPDQEEIFIIHKKIKLLRDDNYILLHGDLHMENTLHKDGQIIAIIDPGLPRGGSSNFDLGVLLNQLEKLPAGKKYLQMFSKGYGGIDWKLPEIVFYAVYREIAKLSFFKTYDPSEYQKRLECDRNEIHSRIDYLKYN